MAAEPKKPKKKAAKAIGWLLENSAFLIIGTIAGLVWANAGPEAHASYERLKHLEIVANPYFGDAHGHGKDGHGHEKDGHEKDGHEKDGHAKDGHAKDGHEKDGHAKDGHGKGGGAHGDHDAPGDHPPMRSLTLHYLINDILMAFFFAIAGKEVWEATLPGGPLSNPRRAAVPLAAAVGGMLGPAALYLCGAHVFGDYAALSSGWAVPCATDIAFSYMVARIVFGPGHPAIPFLLLLAIADDAMGLVILAVAYPQEDPKLLWMLLPVASIAIGVVLRRLRVHSFWPYLLVAGTMSWVGFAMAGLHPALGLLPIIPTLPHAHVDKGLFDWREMDLHDTLNEFEHWWKNPVELILGMFGLLNAGVLLGAIGLPTYLVLGGLLLGKPLGIWLTGMLFARGFGLGLPAGIDSRALFVIGCAGSIGFTVALFISGVAFPPGAAQDAAKMGALFSFAGAILTLVAGVVLRIEKVASPAGGTHANAAPGPTSEAAAEGAAGA